MQFHKLLPFLLILLIPAPLMLSVGGCENLNSYLFSEEQTALVKSVTTRVLSNASEESRTKRANQVLLLADAIDVAVDLSKGEGGAAVRARVMDWIDKNVTDELDKSDAQLVASIVLRNLGAGAVTSASASQTKDAAAVMRAVANRFINTGDRS